MECYAHQLNLIMQPSTSNIFKATLAPVPSERQEPWPCCWNIFLDVFHIVPHVDLLYAKLQKYIDSVHIKTCIQQDIKYIRLESLKEFFVKEVRCSASMCVGACGPREPVLALAYVQASRACLCLSVSAAVSNSALTAVGQSQPGSDLSVYLSTFNLLLFHSLSSCPEFFICSLSGSAAPLFLSVSFSPHRFTGFSFFLKLHPASPFAPPSMPS
ncbi:hypothetical protein GOODEAATRI_021553 [Goodea atripinnis]|uniref:Uncharacterized protein n=1 Tax=Goodea atripinnis TaxID=208336 RepID=A0ABV0NM54_9TELE